MNASDTETFLDSLPRLSRNSRLPFQCHPNVPCFNRCCGDIDLTLSPYDVLRLRYHLDMDSKTFIETHTEMSINPGNRFPAPKLRMMDDALKSCPFVRPDGCSVYQNRPGACRVYPLGRGARIDDDGTIQESFVLVKESHCLGFETAHRNTVEDYLAQQGMASYISFDNRYLQLMHRWSQKGIPLSKPLFDRVFLAAYRPDQSYRAPANAASPSIVNSKTSLTDQENLLNESMMRLGASLF